MSQESPPDDYILIGRLGKTFQLEGGLRFYGLGDAEVEAVYDLTELFVTGLGRVAVTRVRAVGGQTVLYLAGIRRLEQAKPLVNEEVYAPFEALPKDEGQIYMERLIGLPVTLDGEALGEVADVVEAGFKDLLRVATEGGELLVPMQADYVTIEEEGVRLENVPEGLLELHRPGE